MIDLTLGDLFGGEPVDMLDTLDLGQFVCKFCGYKNYPLPDDAGTYPPPVCAKCLREHDDTASQKP
jgi:hypothetical protein